MMTPADIESRRRDIRQGYITWCQGEVPPAMAGAMFDDFIDAIEKDSSDQVPGRTITESELREVAGRLFARCPDLGVFMGRLQRELSELGITHVPEPEPTNAEKLKDLIWDEGDITGYRAQAIAEHLDRLGVKAP